MEKGASTSQGGIVLIDTEAFEIDNAQGIQYRLDSEVRVEMKARNLGNRSSRKEMDKFIVVGSFEWIRLASLVFFGGWNTCWFPGYATFT